MLSTPQIMLHSVTSFVEYKQPMGLQSATRSLYRALGRQRVNHGPAVFDIPRTSVSLFVLSAVAQRCLGLSLFVDDIRLLLACNIGGLLCSVFLGVYGLKFSQLAHGLYSWIGVPWQHVVDVSIFINGMWKVCQYLESMNERTQKDSFPMNEFNNSPMSYIHWSST